MMKKMKAAVLAAGILLGAFVPAMEIQAAEYAFVSAYSETFVPSGDKDGVLTVEIEGEAGKDGYLYIIRSVEGMEPLGQVSGQNLEGEKLEPFTVGSVECFRIKAGNGSSPASLSVQFSCPGFYDVKKKADSNGGEHFPISYKFTNYYPEKIGKYSLKIFLPQGNQVVRVTKPSAYADFILSEENGMRSVGLSKGIGAAGSVNLDFTYDVPASSRTAGKIAIWAACLAVGLAVLADRLKRAKEGRL